MHASCTTKCLTFSVFSELSIVATGFREREPSKKNRSNIQYGDNGIGKNNPMRTDHLVRLSRDKTSLTLQNINKFDKAIVAHFVYANRFSNKREKYQIHSKNIYN